MKVLIAVTHLLGVGHLARAAALGRALAKAGHTVTLVSGGRPAPNVAVEGLAFVQLPPVHVEGTDFRNLLAGPGRAADEACFSARAAMLVEAFDRAGPDAVIVELYPFGRRQLDAEFRALLERCRRREARPAAVLCSIRDVLNPVADARKIERTMRLLGASFDGVLVHSDPEVLPLEASFPVDASLARRLHYTGYLTETSEKNTESAEPSGEIVVSGGGSESALPLMRAALNAATADPGRRWRLLPGHGVSGTQFDQLRAASPANAVVERARPDFPALLARAACSVSQFGYNTALDLAAAGVPAVVVPFDAGNEREQAIRAERFAAMGRVVVVRSEALTGPALLDAAAQAIAAPRASGGLDMAGAARSVGVVEAMVAEGRETAAGWRRLESALARAAGAGREIELWWRDDDAVAPTPRLDRLLELSRRFAAPVALAVIPERAEAALAQRLAGEDLAGVLVHGLAHRNRAPEGRKKQELVAADEQTLAGLAAGRERLAALFGPRALPVLVPPWNRVAPDLVGRLREAGFSGLSAYAGDPALAEPGADGLAIRHTHLDPIDWKGGGGLASRAGLLDRLALLVERAAAAAAGPAPIGLLTHHLVHDEWIWGFVSDLLAVLTASKTVRFVTARAAFGLTRG